MKDLIESFVALGIGFATLAIPLGFDGRVTSAMWTAEGSALLWVGIRQGRMFPRFSGYALSLLGMGAFFLEPKLVTGLTPWLNADYIGVLIIVLSTAFIGLYTRKHSDKVLSIEGELVPPSMLIISVCWWVFGGKLEISTHYLTNQFMFLEAFLAVTSIALLYLSGKVKYDLVKILSIPVALFMLSFIEQNIALLNQGFSMILNENFISFFIIAITHLFLSWYWSTEKRHNLSQLFTSVSYVFLATGLSVFVFLGHSEIFTYLSVDNHTNLSMLFMSVTFVLGVVLAHKLNWKSLHVLSYGFLPYLAIVTLYIVGRAGTFHENLGLLVWCIALLVNYWVLRVYDNDKMQFKKWYHLGSLLLFLFIAVFEYREFVTLVFGELTIWYNASLPFALLIISIGLFMLRNSSIWPLNNYRTTYIKYGLSIVLSLLWLTIIAVNILPPGKATIISYLPVLNAIDITGIMFLVFIWKVLSTQVLPLSKEVNKLVMIGLPITAFIILNASMLRTFHYWYGIDYEFSAMVSSFLVQSAFSILWSLTAVVVMVLASKKQWRIVWLAGLGLMVAVVIKLFLVDMSASGTIARIVAFVSVGLLLSLVGYFSPLPPDINKDKLQDNVFEDQFKQEEE